MPWRRRHAFDLAWEEIYGIHKLLGGFHLIADAWDDLTLGGMWRSKPLKQAFEAAGFEFKVDPKNPGDERARRRC
jgi:hypothetical protein